MVVVLQGSSWERHSLYRLKEADTRCNRTPWPIPQPRPTTLSSRRAACVSKSCCCCCSFQHKYWEQWFVLGVRRVGRSWRWRLPPTPIVTHTWWIVNRCWRPDCRTNPSSYGGSSVTRHYQRLQRMVFVDRSCSCSSYEASRSLALLAQYSTELSFRSQHLISFQNDTLGSISAIVAILGANENKSFCWWRSNRCKMSILSQHKKRPFTWVAGFATPFISYFQYVAFLFTTYLLLGLRRQSMYATQLQCVSVYHFELALCHSFSSSCAGTDLAILSMRCITK